MKMERISFLRRTSGHRNYKNVTKIIWFDCRKCKRVFAMRLWVQRDGLVQIDEIMSLSDEDYLDSDGTPHTCE